MTETVDVTHFEVGDYIEAEFQELDLPRYVGDGDRMEAYRMEASEPTGRTYILKGKLQHHASRIFPEDSTSLEMPDGMCVRQMDGMPGGWLVRIITHKKGTSA